MTSMKSVHASNKRRPLSELDSLQEFVVCQLQVRHVDMQVFNANYK